jgi:hypothetical protein
LGNVHAVYATSGDDASCRLLYCRRRTCGAWEAEQRLTETNMARLSRSPDTDGSGNAYVVSLMRRRRRMQGRRSWSSRARCGRVVDYHAQVRSLCAP